MIAKDLPVIHALWVGGKLGDLSRCCLTSFLMRGHQVRLHAYEEIKDVPQGVTIADANEIVPSSKIIRHRKTGSYALFSDFFRYQLLSQVPGIYVDCDVYCLRPIEIPDAGYLLGLEDDHQVNGAVLALPQNSHLLKRLLDASLDPFFVPPWYKCSKQKRLKVKKVLGFGKSIADMPWGVIGPDAITYFLKELDLLEYASPIDIFYPVHYRCINKLLDGGLNVEDVTTHRTLAVHLYNEMLKRVKFDVLHPDCVLRKFLNNEI
jgi:hypothetical protein